jgi:hypothetical protein
MNPAENWQTATAAPEPPPAVTPQPAPSEAAPPLSRKNPALASLLSIFPGVGHVYNGLYMRGITFFLVVACLFTIMVRGRDMFWMPVAFFWLFNISDAHRQATLINFCYAQDLGLLDLPKTPRAGQGGLVAGVLLSLVGLVAVADRYFEIRLDWIFDLWPFALVAIGIWLIVASFRDRRRA